ncbi:MAG: hypothetical protein JXA18_14565 [Chitinispirillaceae bacterium]|nr:hypothetical protein [Chitinispirillaceae bacterium]
MKPAAHFAASAVVSASIYLSTKSVPVAGASFMCGFLIDVDHFLDYIREYGFRTDSKDFFRVFHETRFTKLVLFLHAWEWTIGLFFLAWFSGWNELILGSFVGVFHHLVLDQWANGATAWGYFFSYRAVKGFSMEAIMLKAMVERKRLRCTRGSGS